MIEGISSSVDAETLVAYGFKLSPGGSHVSRTMMLAELDALLQSVPAGSPVPDYAAAILTDNVLGKTTVTTRQKSLRHLRELYALDEQCPLFKLLRRLHNRDPKSLPQLAFQVAWARDPLLRATTSAVLGAEIDSLMVPGKLEEAISTTFPHQYSELNLNKIARNAASSWTQSGHLVGRSQKVRHQLEPSVVAMVLALALGTLTGHAGAMVFSSPWCRLLDLSPERAKSLAFEAHRAGLIHLRAIGEVVEIGYPIFRGVISFPE